MIRRQSRTMRKSELAVRQRLTPHGCALILHKKRHKKAYYHRQANTLITNDAIHQFIYFFSIYSTAVFSLLFRDFRWFRDNSVLALHQFCVVLKVSRLFNLFFIVRDPKKEKTKKRN